MPTIRIVCLANSYKIGGRCVAGLSLRTGRFIRPVSPSAGGTLTHLHCSTSSNTQAANLEVIELEVVRHSPSPHHPEDYLIETKSRWTRINGHNHNIAQIIDAVVDRDDDLLRGNSDRVATSEITTATPMQRSLQIIKPQRPSLIITTNYNGNRQYRMEFVYKGILYNLVITDDQFTSKYSGLTLGRYEIFQGEVLEKVRLTISLSEQLNGNHFKLIAGVILLP